MQGGYTRLRGSGFRMWGSALDFKVFGKGFGISSGVGGLGWSCAPFLGFRVLLVKHHGFLGCCGLGAERVISRSKGTRIFVLTILVTSSILVSFILMTINPLIIQALWESFK